MNPLVHDRKDFLVFYLEKLCLQQENKHDNHHFETFINNFHFAFY